MIHKFIILLVILLILIISIMLFFTPNNDNQSPPESIHPYELYKMYIQNKTSYKTADIDIDNNDNIHLTLEDNTVYIGLYLPEGNLEGQFNGMLHNINNIPGIVYSHIGVDIDYFNISMLNNNTIHISTSDVVKFSPHPIFVQMVYYIYRPISCKIEIDETNYYCR